MLALRDRYGVTIAGGQGDLKGKIFRIGHIGYYDVFDITTALAAVELALAEPGADIERGAAVDRARSRPTRPRRACDRALRGPRPRADRRGRHRAPARALRRRRRPRLATSPRSIGGYDAIVIRSATKLTADLIERAERLKVIGRAGVGVDNVDVDAATRRGIVVANAPESTVVSAAEQTIGLLVALARNIPQAHAALKQGRWERSRCGGVELADKTLGVLGFGRIGQQVARRALGLGMRVVAYDPFVGDERFRELGVERAATSEAVLAAADFVTLHLPLTDETRGLIDREAIATMRDGVRIVNAARGELVDEEALAEALRSGKVAGAALDVFSDGAVHGAAARARQRRRHAAPRRLDRGGAGPGGRDRRRAGRRRARGRRWSRTRSTSRSSTPRTSRCSARSSRSRRSSAGSRSSSPAAGRTRIAVAAHGPLAEHDTRLLTVAALNGVFQGRVEQAVNYVNAPLIAAERGIEVREERSRASRDYTNLVEVRVRDGDVAVSGTTIGPEPRLFLAGALGFGIDIELAPNLVFFRYDDMPGVIGRVGTMFGEAGVNIANMAVSRTNEGGKALMALSIDTPAPPELVERIHAEGFDDARFISLG